MSSIRARVGATNAIKVIASNSLAGSGSKLSDVSDVDTSTQAHRFVLTYNANTQKYEFVDPDVVLTAVDYQMHSWMHWIQILAEVLILIWMVGFGSLNYKYILD